jgi:hypothetical protein
MSKVKTITTDIIENNYTRRMILKWLIIGFIILGIFYAYFIGSITFNVLARKSLENTALNLSSNISQLELTYLENLNEINKEYALTKGFVDAKNNIFAVRSLNQVALR